jgi:hypothetical protein
MTLAIHMPYSGNNESLMHDDVYILVPETTIVKCLKL